MKSYFPSVQGISRRDILRLALAGLAALAWDWIPWPDKERPPVPKATGLGRVTISWISVRKEPSFRSPRVGYLYRDMVVHLLDEVHSPAGPKHNPRWYRIVGGYIHSAYVQRVQVRYQQPYLGEFPKVGRLGEITVPFTRAWRKLRTAWEKLYRLYYGAVFWVTAVDEGPDGQPWYCLWDDLLHIYYWVPAHHVRLIPERELTPLSPDVPPEEKRIVVDLTTQTLRAYEGREVVLETTISSGIPNDGPTPNGIPTKTPTGRFRIYIKTPSRHMGDGNLATSLTAYELPGVPWVSFFHFTGVSFHGTYWHDNFGTPMSHGCVNMRTEEAKWLYRWSLPQVRPDERYRQGFGTRVEVIEAER